VTVVFRVDASLLIGTGHIMRCLTLAESLKERGETVEFICRLHEGNLIELIKQSGFKVHQLHQGTSVTQIVKELQSLSSIGREELYGMQWLGSTQQQDAEQCQLILEEIKPDWLIVDHYSIDHVWQTLLKGSYKQLMVIDDLANRRHICDLLLDQTYGRNKRDYADFLPYQSEILLGADYALLRLEFAQWREYSLKRRIEPTLKNLLITMGGVDLENITGQVLDAIKVCDLPREVEITVVLGGTAPHIKAIQKQAKQMSYKTQVKINAGNMAELMAKADLAIGAAGATTWERCCMGLPSIQIVLAENQRLIAELIHKAGAALCINRDDMGKLCKTVIKATEQFKSLTEHSKNVCDGTGIIQVLRYLK